MQKKNITRRDFIKGAGLAVSATVIAGCAPIRPATNAPAAAAPSKPAEPAVLARIADSLFRCATCMGISTGYKKTALNEFGAVFC